MRVIRKRKRVRPISRKVVDNPGKGLNKFVSPTLIKDEESSDLKNIMFVEGGSPQKRMGFTQLGDDLSNNPRGMASFDTGSNQYVLTVDGDTLKYLSGSTWTAVGGSETFSTTSNIDFVLARGDLYVYDGTDSIVKLTSALSASRPTTMIDASFGIFYKGYHFASGVDGLGSRVYMSEPADASDFTNADPTGTGEYSVYDATTHPGSSTYAGSGANYFDIQKDDGDEITGFGKFGDVLIIFKRRSIYQLTIPDTTPVIDLVVTGLGSVNHKSIENVENDLFFLSDDGYYVLGNEPNFFDDIRTNELSARVSTLLETRSTANQAKTASIYHNNRFLSTVPVGGSTNNLTFAYDRRYLAWSEWDNVDANSWVVHRDSDGEEHLYFACDSDVKVYEMVEGTYSDDGVAIDAYWTSKSFDLDNFDIEKRWVDLTTQFRRVSGQISIAVYTDGDELAVTTQIGATGSSGLGLGTLGTVVLGEPTGTASSDTVVNVPYRIRVRKNARSLKFKVSNNRNNENFILLSFSMGFYPFSHYKFDSKYMLQT